VLAVNSGLRRKALESNCNCSGLESAINTRIGFAAGDGRFITRFSTGNAILGSFSGQVTFNGHLFP
jgi:hypothetical protein